MQRNHVSIFTVLLAAAVMVTGAHAQGRSSSMPGSQLVRADELIGAEVLDTQGDKIGKIDDLLLDSQGTSVTHAVVTRGGFLGMGMKRHAVPWQELQLSGATHGMSGEGAVDLDDEPAVVINITKDELAQSSPPLDRNAWSEYDGDDLGRASRRVTDILGSDVRGGANDAIGDVEDLVIDADQGRVAYALVDYDGAWDLDADVLSVPWPSLNRNGAALSTSLDENSARRLGYRDADFSRLGDETHRSELYGATNSPGYWAESGGDLARSDASWKREEASDYNGSGAGSGQRGAVAGGRADDYALAGADSLKKRTDPGTTGGTGTTGGMKGEQVTISGTVESVMNPGSAGTSGSMGTSGSTGATPEYGDGLTFRLKPDSGSVVTIDAGSKASLDRQNLKLSQGDRVTVTGHKMSASGSTGGTGATGDMIMATTIQKGSQTVNIERGAMDHKGQMNQTPDKTKGQTGTPRSNG
jgi:sporulation protein YlmC with PRC-barrel domain